MLAGVIQRPRWQLVMWQLVAVVVAMFAGLRMWRPDHSIKLTRILGRAVHRWRGASLACNQVSMVTVGSQTPRP